MILPLKLSLALLVLWESSIVLGDCTVEVNHASWQYTEGRDDEIPGVPTVEECKAHCLSNPVYCRGYTHTTNGVKGFCYLYRELIGMQECSTCSSGTTPEYFEGACRFNNEDEIGAENTESAELCWQKCFETEGCSAYTWYDTTTACFLFSKCEDVEQCSGCHSGKVTCVSIPQCFNYKVLKEESRSIYTETTYPNYHYDFKSADHSSPAWDGEGYYRMVPPAGTVIPETVPSSNRCSTPYPGYLASGSHPDSVGQEVDSAVYLNGRSGVSVNITITKCPGNYFIYYLPAIISGRYCATNEN